MKLMDGFVLTLSEAGFDILKDFVWIKAEYRNDTLDVTIYREHPGCYWMILE